MAADWPYGFRKPSGRWSWQACRAVPDPLSFDPIEEAGRQWREHWGTGPVAPMMAVTSVMRVQQILIARLNATLEPFDLTFARYEALMLLYFSRAGSLPLGKMGARLQVHPTSVTNLIDGLERRGLVTRAPHPSDRRTTLATITNRGREIAREATSALHAIDFGLGALSPAELSMITDILRRIRVAAGDFAPSPGTRNGPWPQGPK
jgi:DNA-binding MarR family transcriptional regulator